VEERKKSNWNGKCFSNHEVATVLVKAKRLDSADARLTQSHNESCAYPDCCQWSLGNWNDQNRGLTSPHHFENKQFRSPPHNPQLGQNKKKIRIYSALLLCTETEIAKL
jgi:hypothetical protein